jgi:hypothetical protein
MTPDEVESHVRQLCAVEGGVLRHLFGTDNAPAPGGGLQHRCLAGMSPAEQRDLRVRRWRLRKVLGKDFERLPEVAGGGSVERLRAELGLSVPTRPGPEGLYKHFFLRALAVPPNRCRAASLCARVFACVVRVCMHCVCLVVLRTSWWRGATAGGALRWAAATTRARAARTTALAVAPTHTPVPFAAGSGRRV